MNKKITMFVFILIMIQLSACSTIFRYMKDKRNKNYREGITLYKQKKYAEAHNRFDTVVSIDPKYKKAKYYLKKTSNILTRKEKRVHRRANKYYSKGMRLIKARKYEAALNTFLIVQKSEPDYEDLDDQIDLCREKLSGKYKRKFKTANRLYKRKKYKKAYKLCIAAKKYKPDSTELVDLMDDIQEALNKRTKRYRDRAEKLYSKNRLEPAKKQLAKALKINPWDKDSRKLRREIDIKLTINTDYKEAVKLFKKKKHFPAYTKFNSINRKKSGYRSTEKYLKRLKKILSKNVGKFYKRGIQFYNSEKFKAAINEWNKVLSFNPNHKKALEYKKRAKAKLDIKRSLGGS